MDGWDHLAATDKALLDEAQDGQSEITIREYIPKDPWFEAVNS